MAYQVRVFDGASRKEVSRRSASVHERGDSQLYQSCSRTAWRLRGCPVYSPGCQRIVRRGLSRSLPDTC
jgi:hypothetical protein